MVGRLGLLLSSQQRFVAHAAHELRAPLTVIEGPLALALRRPREPECVLQNSRHLLGSRRGHAQQEEAVTFDVGKQSQEILL